MTAAQFLTGWLGLLGWAVFVAIVVFCVVDGYRAERRQAEMARRRRIGDALNPARVERRGGRP